MAGQQKSDWDLRLLSINTENICVLKLYVLGQPALHLSRGNRIFPIYRSIKLIANLDSITGQLRYYGFVINLLLERSVSHVCCEYYYYPNKKSKGTFDPTARSCRDTKLNHTVRHHHLDNSKYNIYDNRSATAVFCKLFCLPHSNCQGSMRR